VILRSGLELGNGSQVTGRFLGLHGGFDRLLTAFEGLVKALYYAI